MANINDFKLLNAKCRKYFDLLKITNDTIDVDSETKKARFGFYFFVLEELTQIKDISDLVGLITDQEFNEIVLGVKHEDYGIDAIYIDEDNHFIKIFNFKFREQFNEDRKQSINESFLSTKFINSILNNDTNGIENEIIKNKADEIIAKIKSNEIWHMQLYVVSNELKTIDPDSMELKPLKEMYGLNVIPIGLNEIAAMISIEPQNINATLLLDIDCVIPFVEDSRSSSKSFIIKLSVIDLIRITCTDQEIRNKYNLEDYSCLANQQIDYNVLFENVRGLIINSKYNKNILNTLSEEPSKFFMYNNGITITAKDISTENTNVGKKIKFVLSDLQVVNGGQTLRTIHLFNQQDEENITKYLSNCYVLVRVFKTSDTNIKNRIAQYTNSQNTISNADLKSLNPEQIQIEQYLNEKNIVYVRKTGDTGLDTHKNYRYRISMEKLGQILFAVQGSPDKVSIQKKEIFDKYYDQIFKSKNFEIEQLESLIAKYYEIRTLYLRKLPNRRINEQKVFYLLFLSQSYNIRLERQIKLLETTLKSYRKEDKINESQKLSDSGFKERIELEFELEKQNK